MDSRSFEQLLQHPVRWWPAYGLVPAGSPATLSTHCAPPTDWLPLEEKFRTEEWKQWLSRMSEVINRTLWPSFDFNNTSWPAGATEAMHTTTAADFSVMVGLQNELSPRFEQQVRSPACGIWSLTHREFYWLEDGRSTPGAQYADYDRLIPPEASASVARIMERALPAKAGEIAQYFKLRLQRPRPSQMALAFGLYSLQIQPTLTGACSSMIGGHCFEGLMMAGAVMDDWAMRSFDCPRESWIALKQFAVDYGDRRVLAGVNYPSDNLAAWILAMDLAPRVFRHPHTAVRLWKAITKYSAVYQRMRQNTVTQAFQMALEELNMLLPGASVPLNSPRPSDGSPPVSGDHRAEAMPMCKPVSQ